MDINKGLWPVANHAIAYLKAQNAQGNHILMQPAWSVESCYLIADDLNPAHLSAHQYQNGNWKPGRMIVRTSPDNYQVWIHSSRPLSLAEKRYWLKKMHSDPGADPHHRWGRCPGFFNTKLKHRSDSGAFPLSKLVWIDYTGRAHLPITCEQPLSRIQPPVLTRSLSNNISRSDYERGNDSATDFAYALAMARRCVPKHEIITRLLQERTNWHHHRGDDRKLKYIERSVSKAIAIIQDSS